MSRYSYPHVIENGQGEQLVFERKLAVPRGERLEGYNRVKPGAGPPMHVHHYSDESFTVVSGRLGYQRLGAAEQFAGPGETVTFKAGEAHRFWNPDDSDLVCTAWVEPADNVEYLLTELFESTKRSGKGRPDLFEVAFLMTRYRSEFGPGGVPGPMVRIGFPFLTLLGRLLGRYRRYADAPEPVRRD